MSKVQTLVLMVSMGLLNACGSESAVSDYEPGDQNTLTGNSVTTSTESSQVSRLNNTAIGTQVTSSDATGAVTSIQSLSGRASTGNGSDNQNLWDGTILYSEQELKAAKRRIVNQWSYLQDNGLIIASISVDLSINRVVVNIGESTSMFDGDIQALLGDEVVYKYSPDTLIENRIRPYDHNLSGRRGGATITNQSGGICTSGFMWSIHEGNRDNFITAAHCTETGEDLYNGDISYARTFASSFGSNNSYDSARGDWAYADTNWAGTTGLPHIYVEDYLYRMVQYYWPQNLSQLGESVCFSGTTTGKESCGFVVQKEDMCLRSENRLVCGLTSATNTQYNTSGKPGDSGGPVYTRLANGNIAAAGIVTGGSTTESSTMYYTPISVIMESLPGRPWTCTEAGTCN